MRRKLRGRLNFNETVFGVFEDRSDLLSSDPWKPLHKLIDSWPGFQVLKKRAPRDPRAPQDPGTGYRFFIALDR